MQKTILFTLCCFFAMQPFLFAQSIKGKITDETNAPLDAAVISLLSVKDKSLVKTTLSEADGSFLLEQIKANDYLIQVSNVGFMPYESEKITIQNADIQLPTIRLAAAVKNLQAVTISSKTPFIERKIDRTVINVEAQIANAGATALEALERAPGVLIDQNGAIAMKGKAGVLVYIDDKPSYMSGEALQNYLRSLPASAIKQIELITNPPAKYDAAGNAGIINIKTKRNKLKGVFGNFALNYNQGIYARSNNSFSLNYNNKRIGFFTNMNLGVQNVYQDLFINRNYLNQDASPASFFNQNSIIRKTIPNGNLKMGLDYYFSDKTTLGIVFQGLANKGDEHTDNTSLVSNAKRQLVNTVVADNNQQTRFRNGGVALNLRHQIDSLGQNITFDLDYFKFYSNDNQRFINRIYQADNKLDYTDQLKGILPSHIGIYAFKSDYTKPLQHDATLEAGVKTAYTKTDNTADYRNYDFNTQLETTNFDLSNRFKYDEVISAAYLNYNRNFKRVEMQSGLRFENTIMRGNQLGNGVILPTKFNRNYCNLFPTLYLNYKLDSAGNNTLGFSYGRRIERPIFENLNPFVSPLDKFTFYAGNPFLTPTFAHNLTLTFSYQGIWVTNLNYYLTKDGIYETLEISEKDGKYYSRPNNVGQAQVFNIDMSFGKPLTKKITINLYAEAGRMQYKSQIYTEQLDAGKNYILGQGNVSFQLPKQFIAEVSANGQSDILWGQLLLKNWGVVNLSFQKKLFQNKGNLRLNFNDIFYTRRGSGVINNLRLTYADWNSKFDSRQMSATFSYNFGKATKGKTRYKGSGSESERQRVQG
jgi:hypothetical protein